MILLTQWTQQDIQALIIVMILLGIHFVLRLFKDTPLHFLYRGWCMFWLILFATLAINFAKDELKKWWDK
jgi:hypothetical protein